MGFKFRRLLDYVYNDTVFCAANCSLSYDSYYCNGFCLPYHTPPPPSPPPPSHHANRTKFLVTGLSLSAAFFLVFTSVMYYKFCHSPTRRRRQDQRNETTHEEFLDENHDPVDDLPIWYINTVGLQPYVINSIPVVNYRRGDGLVEGTDCSVCLNEFQQDETLRLLSKCNHAFHLTCIDTWLRSHTNCPLCRSPVVASSGSGEETQIVVTEIDQESERELEGGDGERSGGIEEERELEYENRIKKSEILNPEEDGMFRCSIRRSLSLGSLSAFKVNQALANASPMDSDGNSTTGFVKESESNMRIAPRNVGDDQNLLKSMISSSAGR